jgi:nicotinate-nucleotide adenylyltransferase
VPPVTIAQRVGLLGGSFNPAHEGHLHISGLALECLKLDQVWWIVSPQNPMKAVTGMAPFAVRFREAKKTAIVNQRIVVSDFEAKTSSCYTVETISALKAQFPGISFVWVMGADLLVQLPHWKRWRQLFRTLPIAIFDRPAYSSRALRGRAARHFKSAQISRFRAQSLVDMKAPAWLFLRTRLNPQSATRIRAEAQYEGKD